MKLFQRLLVAPAALGLLAPLSASATNVNLNDISNYSKGEVEINSDSFKPLSTVNPLLSGGEGLIDNTSSSNNYSSDTFSSTTTMDGKAVFTLGQVDTDTDSYTETVIGTYMYNVNLNSSFTLSLIHI